MELGFLGAATTVTGSQFLLTTSRARVLIVRCQIRSISGFSAHADESELLDWIGAFKKPRVKRVFIVHGDTSA